MPSSLVAPAIGAVVGGIGGSKDQTSTQTTKPWMSKEQEKRWEDAMARGEKASNVGFDPIVKMRATTGAGTSPFGALFDNPELLAIQADADNKLAQSVLNPPKPTAPAEAGMKDAQYYELLGRQLFNSGNMGFTNRFGGNAGKYSADDLAALGRVYGSGGYGVQQEQNAMRDGALKGFDMSKLSPNLARMLSGFTGA